MEKSQKQFRLLPHYFKQIGASLILFTLFLFIPGALFLISPDPSEDYRQLTQIISLDIVIAGLFLYCLAEDKVEDELILLLRMQAIAFAFTFGVVNVIIQPIVNFLFSGHFVDVKSQQVVLTMLVVYQVVFIFKKKNR